MNRTEANKILEDAAAKVGEHFDAVVVIGSWKTEGEQTTEFSSRGSGNHFARQGMCKAYLQYDLCDEIGGAVASKMPQPPKDDSEEWKESI